MQEPMKWELFNYSIATRAAGFSLAIATSQIAIDYGPSENSPQAPNWRRPRGLNMRLHIQTIHCE
jgi:hypothetical protein